MAKCSFMLSSLFHTYGKSEANSTKITGRERSRADPCVYFRALSSREFAR